MKRLILIVVLVMIFVACDRKENKEINEVETIDTAAMLPEEDASQFVSITDVVPDAILEIRYFSSYNFIGERIPQKS